MDMQKLMQQAQQMQKKLTAAQDELNNTIYEGKSGGSNGVSIKMNGKNEVTEVNINEELLDKENKEELQDLILLAMNSAVEQASVDREEKLGSVTGGLNLPGM